MYINTLYAGFFNFIITIMLKDEQFTKILI